LERFQTVINLGHSPKKNPRIQQALAARKDRIENYTCTTDVFQEKHQEILDEVNRISEMQRVMLKNSKLRKAANLRQIESDLQAEVFFCFPKFRKILFLPKMRR
jgi:hypothetical protein